MISYINNIFKLDTKNTSYVIRISFFNHVLSDYYGAKIIDNESFEFSKEKYGSPYGTTVNYKEEDFNYSLDMLSLEVSSVGKGDFKEPSIIIDNGKDYILYIINQAYDIKKSLTKLNTLPSPHKELEELVIHLKDELLNIKVDLHYIVDEESDVIIRNTIIINESEKDIYLNKAMSMQLDMINKNFSLINLYGGWGFEGQKSEVNLTHGIYINDSKTGNSSNRHNPFIMLKQKEANYHYGDVYAFNLIYSGNHYEMVELSSFNKLRVQLGINP